MHKPQEKIRALSVLRQMEAGAVPEETGEPRLVAPGEVRTFLVTGLRAPLLRDALVGEGSVDQVHPKINGPVVVEVASQMMERQRHRAKLAVLEAMAFYSTSAGLTT